MTLVLIGGMIVLAGLAQWYRWQRDVLALAVVDAHKWIDEIIEALESDDEVEADRAIHRLAAEFRNDDRSVLPGD